jgi:hypothetical protein
MRSGSCLILATLFTGIALSALPCQLSARESDSVQAVAGAAEIPEAPQPQSEVAAVEPPAQPDQAAQGQGTQQPAPSAAPAQGSSSSQTPAQQAETEKNLHDKAAEQLKQQEQQRVMGVMATFNTTRNKDALPLSPGQKFQLFFKSATDPWPFMLAGVVSEIGQLDHSPPEWGQGVEGYAKRYGASYSDYFIGNFFGNAVLPSVLHEDPRYFQKGTGSMSGRFLWAAASTVWCKRDNGGWGPNWSNVVGNLMGTAIARVYYPPADRTVTDTLTDGFTVTAEGIVGSEVIEFWPDMVRHHRRKQAEKLARQTARSDAQSAAQSAPSSAPAAKPMNPQN